MTPGRLVLACAAVGLVVAVAITAFVRRAETARPNPLVEEAIRRPAEAPPRPPPVAPVAEGPRYFVHVRGATYGPVDAATVRGWIATGLVTARESICPAEGGGWRAIFDHPDFANLFDARDVAAARGEAPPERRGQSWDGVPEPWNYVAEGAQEGD